MWFSKNSKLARFPRVKLVVGRYTHFNQMSCFFFFIFITSSVGPQSLHARPYKTVSRKMNCPQIKVFMTFSSEQPFSKQLCPSTVLHARMHVSIPCIPHIIAPIPYTTSVGVHEMTPLSHSTIQAFYEIWRLYNENPLSVHLFHSCWNCLFSTSLSSNCLPR